MTKEQKELLIQDLSARLPYRVIISCPALHRVFDLTRIDRDVVEDSWYLNGICEIDDCKPYLRPMSSMTEEECKELGDLPATMKDVGETLPNIPYYIEVSRPEQLDWLNKKGFDYRGLIPMGLALDSTPEE